jgi:hypothetical protein
MDIGHQTLRVTMVGAEVFLVVVGLLLICMAVSAGCGWLLRSMSFRADRFL